MTKREFTHLMAEKGDIYCYHTREWLDLFVDTLLDVLSKEERINIDDKQVKLHYWNTEEEAFQEYKLFKESEIRVLALRYRDKIPDKLFDALIKYEVRPYSPYES